MCAAGNQEESRSFTTASLLKLYRNMPTGRKELGWVCGGIGGEIVNMKT